MTGEAIIAAHRRLVPCLGANAEGVTSAWTRTAISPAHAAKRHQAVCLPPRTHILKRHKSGTLACFRVSVSVIAVGEDAGRRLMARVASLEVKTFS